VLSPVPNSEGPGAPALGSGGQRLWGVEEKNKYRSFDSAEKRFAQDDGFVGRLRTDEATFGAAPVSESRPGAPALGSGGRRLWGVEEKNKYRSFDSAEKRFARDDGFVGRRRTDEATFWVSPGSESRPGAPALGSGGRRLWGEEEKNKYRSFDSAERRFAQDDRICGRVGRPGGGAGVGSGLCIYRLQIAGNIPSFPLSRLHTGQGFEAPGDDEGAGYSMRRARTGLMEAARRAGMMAAMAAARARTAMARARTRGLTLVIS